MYWFEYASSTVRPPTVRWPFMMSMAPASATSAYMTLFTALVEGLVRELKNTALWE